MVNGPLRTVLSRWSDLKEIAPSDGELLARFVADKNQAAFTALVQRHGGLVLGVCRRALHNETDAEDAFQTTFLLLALKATTIRKHASLASWLHGVARRIALNARRSIMRRLHHERTAPPAAHSLPASPGTLRELQAILDEEVERLPERNRAPFVLCCLEGHGRLEAARILGCSEGTLSSRLARARQRIQERLTRRGICMSTAMCAAAVAASEGKAAVSQALARATARAATGFASGNLPAAIVSDRTLAWTRAMLRTITFRKLALAAALLLMLASLGSVGAAFCALQELPSESSNVPAAVQSEVKQAPTAKAQLSAKTVIRSKTPLEGEKLEAELVLTNDGDAPLRLCTLVSQFDSRGAGRAEVTCQPDSWKSDSPSPDQSARHLVTLKPGERVAIPINLGGVRGVKGKFTLTTVYAVGKKFSQQHETWSGTVTAEPVVVPVEEVPGPRELVRADLRALQEYFSQEINPREAAPKRPQTDMARALKYLREAPANDDVRTTAIALARKYAKVTEFQKDRGDDSAFHTHVHQKLHFAWTVLEATGVLATGMKLADFVAILGDSTRQNGPYTEWMYRSNMHVNPCLACRVKYGLITSLEITQR
jgi:RNA polymerase sigma factor (sigma-70 family)